MFSDNIQGQNINVHVGDNVAPSGGGGDFSQEDSNDPNVNIPASGKYIMIAFFDFDLA